MSPTSGRKRKPATATDRPPLETEAETPIVAEIGARFAELREELLEYVAIRIARLKLSLWQKLLGLVAIALGVVFVLAVVVTAVVLCFTGIAGAIAEATSRPWLGSLLAGGIGLLAMTVALLIVRGVLRRKSAGKASECPDDESR
jgi:hypothetical protein